MPLALQTAGDGRLLSQFIALPYRLHRSDPLWTPLLRRDVKALLSRRKNLFFEHAEGTIFTAYKGGQCVGRITAQIDRAHLDRHKDDTGSLRVPRHGGRCGGGARAPGARERRLEALVHGLGRIRTWSRT